MFATVVIVVSVSVVCCDKQLPVGLIISLQLARMADADSETLEDVENTPLADETDDSCVLQLIEIVPLDRPSDDYCKQERIDPVVEVKPEDLQDVKQEPADDYTTEHACFTIPVRSACTYAISILLLYVCIYITTVEKSKTVNGVIKICHFV